MTIIDTFIESYTDFETIVAVIVFILLMLAITGVVYIFTSILDKKKEFSIGLFTKLVIACGVSFFSITLCIKIVETISESGKIIE